MRQPRIISLGEVLWDLFPDGERFGGAPANFACHATILGREVTMVSAVGDDDRGREAIRILEGLGIDTRLVQIIPEATTGSVGVETDSQGKPQYTIHRDAAWDRIAGTPELATRVEAADAVYFGTLGQRGALSRATIRRALEAAKSAGVLRILDINLRPPFFDDTLIRDSIEQAGILKLSDDEFESVLKACEIPSGGNSIEALRSVLERYKLESIVMTRGAEGALLVSADDAVEQPGIPAEVVDTVGAGDAFTAAFLVGQLCGEETNSVLQRACEVASAVCAQPGAIPTQTFI